MTLNTNVLHYDPMRVEITHPLVLRGDQKTLLTMHSFLNVMNVLISSLQLIDFAVPDKGSLDRSLSRCRAVVDSLTDSGEAIKQAQMIGDTKDFILGEIEQIYREQKIEGKTRKEIEEMEENIKSCFSILEIRVREILSRQSQPEEWIPHSIETLRNNFFNVFRAIERNAQGRYRIVYNAADQTESDYLVNLVFIGNKKGTILMPGIVQDVFRDLLANARKYTPPGKRINGRLENTGPLLSITVADQGKGIPPEKIADTVNFGYRAENVADTTTYGGGFGLTKAYFVTRQFNGRMWIDSELEKGTEIYISIPVPPKYR